MAGPVWVILPTYDEAQCLAPMVAAIRAALEGEAFRILVVDDNSPDGTGEIADGLAAEFAEVRVLHRPGRAGLAKAYIGGFGVALSEGAGHVVEMDADFSHDPEDLPRLLAHARAGADLVLGSRYVPGGGVVNWGRRRRFLSRAGCLYARLVLRVPVRDLTGGFKCFDARALASIGYESARSEGYAFQVELTHRALQRGLRVVEIPIVFHERREGRSKMSGRIAVEAAWRVPRLRRYTF